MGVDEVLEKCTWRVPQQIAASNDHNRLGILESDSSLFDAEQVPYEGTIVSHRPGITYDIVTIRESLFVKKGDELLKFIERDIKERIPKREHPMLGIEVYATHIPMSTAKQTYPPEDPTDWHEEHGVYTKEDRGIHLVVYHEAWEVPE